MPSKYEEKIYIENCYYHLYNRGVEKREIFLDKQDYSTYLSYIKTYLLPQEKKELLKRLADSKINLKEKDRIIKLLRLNNYCNTLNLIAYCLMPNHFHFLVYQTAANTIDKFMNSLGTRYSMYFNRKYKRVGPLFQGNYKAVIVENDEQLLHLSRYIHLQAISRKSASQSHLQGVPLQIPLQIQQPSSYLNYLGKITQEWVKPEKVLSYFKSDKRTSNRDILSYQAFVEEYKEEDEEKQIIKNLAFDY